MKYYVLLFFLLHMATIKAQYNTIDSLQAELKNHPKQDSIRLGLLVDLAWKMTYSKPKEAMPYVNEATAIASKLDWPKGKARALRQKGNLYYVMANYLKALDVYQQALGITQDNGFKSLESSILNNIGNIHADLKEYDHALRNYKSFLSTSKTLGNVSDQIKALTNIAIVYNDLSQFSEGIAYLKNALELAKQENNDFFVAAITNNLALAYKGLEQYEEALVYYHEAAELAQKIQNKYIEASALNSIGKINILLKKYELAKMNGQKALTLSEDIAAAEWQADSWKVLSTAYESLGKMDSAFVAYKRYVQLRDSVLNEEKKSELTRKEMQFQMERQEDAAKEEIEKQRLVKNGYLIGSIFLSLVSLAGYLLYKRKRDISEKRKIADFKAKVAETELKALRSQMNPHFVFNSLNSISDFILKNNIQMANRYLIKFSKLIRSILENSERKWISLEEDLELMELYIQIEALRLNNKLSYSIHIDDSIDKENTMVPPLILQPFVENSIWHGIAKKEGEGHIRIEIKKDRKMIKCTVDDDGIGRSQKTNSSNGTKNNSMGHRITKTRLDIINQLKNSHGSVKIVDKSNGTRIELILPLELQF